MNTNDIIEKCASIAESEPVCLDAVALRPQLRIAKSIRALKTSLPTETVSDAMVESLRNIRRAIVEDTTALNDTLWMPDDVPGGKGASVIDYIDQTLEVAALAHADDGWRPIESAPKDGTWVLLAGPSGCSTTPLRVEVCRWYPEYRPRNPWQNHSNDAFTDGGKSPTHWRPLPAPPKDGRE